jgi:hypothetical protein
MKSLSFFFKIATVSLLGLLVAAGCGPATGKTKDNTNNNNNSSGPCTEGETRCDASGTMVQVCVSGQWELQTTCMGATPYCYMGQCVTCQPNQRYCEGNQVYQCDANGTSGQVVETCDEAGGETCVAGNCVSLCEQAEDTNSYIGCEYWAASTANPQLDGAFNNDYSLVVHNGNEVPATVSITKNEAAVTQEVVQPGEMKVIQLAYDPDLKLDPENMESMIVVGGAYHVISTVPVTVYQFNPLNYELNTQCEVDPYLESPPCFSHSNDASLLLPAHVLSVNYMIMARPTFGVAVDQGLGMGEMGFIPGYFTIVGTENNTTVTVNFSAHTKDGPQVGAFAPGDSQQFQLNAGQVMQIISAIPTSCTGEQSSDDCNGQTGATCEYCNMQEPYDLTGTVIQSTAPVAVFSGHICDFVPYNFWACDHLEEQMIPSESWGKKFIATRTEPQSPDTPEPNLYKILSRDDGNTVTFYPSSVHQQVNLDAGQYVAFMSTEDFSVESTQPMMVAQFTVGQNYYTTDLDYHGDPAFALVVPFEQYRDTYNFLVPETITYNFVNIIAEVGEAGQDDPGIVLDGGQISFAGASPIGNTRYAVVRVDLSNSPIPYHTISGAQPFGIMVYGFAKYTSYFYPGGLNLDYIYPVE